MVIFYQACMREGMRDNISRDIGIHAHERDFLMGRKENREG